ncbi:3-hydroxyacyl-ACP dehydratase FabZ [Amedibacillus sp. YH-ame6]
MIYNSNDIQKIIPHRYPFLLVDRIESIEGNVVVGTKCISANEMQFLGHFPEKHIMPGVLMLEAMAQTVAVMLLSKEENKGKIGLFAGINKARFKRQVIPGDVLRMECEITNERMGIAFVKAVASVEGEIAVQAELMFAIDEA